MVYPEYNSFKSDRVNLRWGNPNDDNDDHVYDCTCHWCLRWKIPCRHVLAAAKGENTDSALGCTVLLVVTVIR